MSLIDIAHIVALADDFVLDLQKSGRKLNFYENYDWRVTPVKSLGLTLAGREQYGSMADGEVGEVECERPSVREVFIPDHARKETHEVLSCQCRIGTKCLCPSAGLTALSHKSEKHSVLEVTTVLVRKMDRRFCGTVKERVQNIEVAFDE